jgi:SAM-dependent methyltransferase
MPATSQEYVLGATTSAARRLEIQDAHFAEVSEKLLDALALRPGNRIVEFGCGPGGMSRRILRRLGPDGVLVAVDRTAGLLDQARALLAGEGPGTFEPVLADLTELGPWLDGADVVLGRAVLHHVPMAEFFLGRLLARLRSGTRLGFIEPDFRAPLARVARLEAGGRPELAALRAWAVAINDLYQLNRLSPAVGASLGRALEFAGCRDVRSEWSECRSDGMMLENMLMFYDEVRDRLTAHGIMTASQIDEQKNLLSTLPTGDLPPAWATFRVTAVV